MSDSEAPKPDDSQETLARLPRNLTLNTLELWQTTQLNWRSDLTNQRRTCGKQQLHQTALAVQL